MKEQELFYEYCKTGNLEGIKRLKNINIKRDDNHAIICATYNGHLDVVKYLHENDADIKAKDNMAIRLASYNGHLETVKYLIRYGVDINKTDILNYDDIYELMQSGVKEFGKYTNIYERCKQDKQKRNETVNEMGLLCEDISRIINDF